MSFPSSSFLCPSTGVNPLQGFIRPALRYPGFKARHHIESHSPLETHAAILVKGWADEASPGTHPRSRAKY